MKIYSFISPNIQIALDIKISNFCRYHIVVLIDVKTVFLLNLLKLSLGSQLKKWSFLILGTRAEDDLKKLIKTSYPMLNAEIALVPHILSAN